MLGITLFLLLLRNHSDIVGSMDIIVVEGRTPSME
jgi:hypothetical protein